jgi:prolyl oligopeptidase
MHRLIPAALLACGLGSTLNAADSVDPRLWLEDIDGEDALAWVAARNAESTAAIETQAGYPELRQRLEAIFDSKERLVYVSQLGDRLYNFWQDAEHPRGIWRRTTLAEYRKPQPAWETIIDVDALGHTENTSWVWKGVQCLRPAGERCLVSLSRGGGDAVEVREFDLAGKHFVADGFKLTQAKSKVEWADRDTLLVGTDFGAGSLTDSGYPRIVKRWKRGTPIAAAETVYAGEKTDVSVTAWTDHTPGFERQFIQREPSFFTTEVFEIRPGGLRRLDKPDSAQLRVWRDQVLITLRKDWNVAGHRYPQGALLAMPYARFVQGARNFDVLFTPDARTSLQGFITLRHGLVLQLLDNVRGRIVELVPGHQGWKRHAVEVPESGTATVLPLDPMHSDAYLLTTADFLTPSTLSLAELGKREHERIQSLPAFFNTEGLAVRQFEAVSRDGTHVPYFVVEKADAKHDGSQPTLLYGYGGFELSMEPNYSPAVGAGWIEQGGAYVLANIRGGGEFGPAWHEAALREKRQNAYDDFISIAEDLVRRKITSPAHLGIMGGSNGGLLVGAVEMQRPDLFGAVVCQVPLLDMKRFHLLLAGASWMAEYGNPDDPADWAFISKYSPYQNFKPGTKYPRTFFVTSTRDDRVHPGHARKMAAQMLDDKQDVLYFENMEGGHAGAADNRQRAQMWAMAYEFLLTTLK